MYPGRVRGWFIFCRPCLAFRVPSVWVKPRGNFEVTQMDSVDQTQESYSQYTEHQNSKLPSRTPERRTMLLFLESFHKVSSCSDPSWEVALGGPAVQEHPFLYPQPILVFSSHSSHLKQVTTITNWKSYATKRCSWWEANASVPGFPKISQNHYLTGGSLARTHGSLRYRTMFSDLCVRETGGL